MINTVIINCTFFNNCSTEEITMSMYHLCRRIVSAKESAQHFLEKYWQLLDITDRRDIKYDDVQNSRILFSEWLTTSKSTQSTLKQQLNGPNILLFFMDIFYLTTTMKVNSYNMLFYFTTGDYLDSWKKIKVILLQ